MSDTYNLIPVSKARELAKDNGPDSWIQPMVLSTVMQISNKIKEEATLGKLSCMYVFGPEFSDSIIKSIKQLDDNVYYSSDFKKELERRAIWHIIRMLHDAGYKVEYHFSWDNDSQANRAKLSIYWHDWEEDDIDYLEKIRKNADYIGRILNEHPQ